MAEVLRADNFAERAFFSLYVNLVNLASELTQLAAGPSEIYNKVLDGRNASDSAAPYAGQWVYEYFELLSKSGFKDVPPDWMKMADAGFHPHTKYDTESHEDPNVRLWGLQFRSLARDRIGPSTDDFINRVQEDMLALAELGERYVLPSWFQTWFEEVGFAIQHDSKAYHRIMHGFWYNQQWPLLLDTLPAGLAPFRPLLAQHAQQWQGDPDAEGYRDPDLSGDRHMELKLLAFDWSHFPPLHGRPGLHASILREQQLALAALGMGQEPSEVVHRFVRATRLAQFCNAMLGSVLEEKP